MLSDEAPDSSETHAVLNDEDNQPIVELVVPRTTLGVYIVAMSLRALDDWMRVCSVIEGVTPHLRVSDQRTRKITLLVIGIPTLSSRRLETNSRRGQRHPNTLHSLSTIHPANCLNLAVTAHSTWHLCRLCEHDHTFIISAVRFVFE